MSDGIIVISDDDDTCQELCEQFTKSTQIETTCAPTRQQGKSFNLPNANTDLHDSACNTQPDGKKFPDVIVISDDEDELERKSDIKFITWNLDGLEENNLLPRCKHACKVIKSEDADIVFLQEIVPDTAKIIEREFPGYRCIWGNDCDYFTGTLLKKNTISYLGHEVCDYPTTVMDRNLLQVNIKIRDIPLLLLNTHLESTQGCRSERINQLKMVFDRALEAPIDKTVVFGGDLNLRDKELNSIGSLPNGIEDVWVMCGSRKEHAFTWDMRINDSFMLRSHHKPRFRFDRVLFRQSLPVKITPKYFGLIGLERLSPHGCFPSDHWGIVCHFQLKI